MSALEFASSRNSSNMASPPLPRTSAATYASAAVTAVRQQFKRHPIWWCLVGFRTVDALVQTSYFQPDEYFQALEPAWQMVFGERSGAWITWVSRT